MRKKRAYSLGMVVILIRFCLFLIFQYLGTGGTGDTADTSAGDLRSLRMKRNFAAEGPENFVIAMMV